MESQPEMEFAEYFLWTNICVCLPLTTLVIFWVFCMVRREQAPITYYINLLIANLIQFIMIVFVKNGQYHPIISVIYIMCLMVSLYFRMFIAMERCFVITCPQSNWIRQTGRSMLVSFLVWILFIIALTLSTVFFQIIPLFAFALLPAPLFIFFSAWTFKALPAATSVPTDEKRRIVGTLVLLFINYFLMILPAIISLMGTILPLNIPFVLLYIIFALFLLSPFADLILVFFMRNKSTDKLPSHLCCCITNDTAEGVAGHQQLHELMLQRERERKSEPNHVKTVEKVTENEHLQILR